MFTENFRLAARRSQIVSENSTLFLQAVLRLKTVSARRQIFCCCKLSLRSKLDPLTNAKKLPKPAVVPAE